MTETSEIYSNLQENTCLTKLLFKIENESVISRMIEMCNSILGKYRIYQLTANQNTIF